MGAKGSEVQKITTDCNVQIKFPDKAVGNGTEVPVVTKRQVRLGNNFPGHQIIKMFRSSNPIIIRITGKEENCKGAYNVLLEVVYRGDHRLGQLEKINLSEKHY